MSRSLRRYWIGGVSIVVSGIIFVVPFAVIVLTAIKNKQEASLLQFTWPSQVQLFENLRDVWSEQNDMLLTAYINSTIITVVAVTLLVVFAAMTGYVLQRRKTRATGFVDFVVLFVLIMPPSVVTTISVLQELHMFKTLTGMILIETAYGLPFSVLLFRAFVSTIPRELDEAAIIDGAGPLGVFFRVVLPLLRPVTVTVIVVQSVAIFNDFTNPLYYLPGSENATVQVTLYNFQSLYDTSYNLLFMNILLITIPPLIIFLFFNRQIVAGMTAGAVKG
jgi:raffinose/stachyose/melibiose transport system permease protein